LRVHFTSAYETGSALFVAGAFFAEGGFPDFQFRNRSGSAGGFATADNPTAIDSFALQFSAGAIYCARIFLISPAWL
jgi:hypothetical protein